MRPKRKSYTVTLLLLATYAFGGYLGFLYLPSMLSKWLTTNLAVENVFLSVIAGVILTLLLVMIFASYRKDWEAKNWGCCAILWHKFIPQSQRHQAGAIMMTFDGFAFLGIGLLAPFLVIRLLSLTIIITMLLPMASILEQGPTPVKQIDQQTS